jgi:alpha-galactosidase
MFLASFVITLSAEVPESAFEKDPYPQEKGPVKVFILAGQSNMQGHASLRTLEYLIYNEQTAEEYEQWKNREGRWVERNDVWVWTTDGARSGSLKPGFGASEMKIGPELGFGWVVGKQLDQQVLLIKTCWGGKSVKRDFLPPGAEPPSAEMLQQDLERARKRNPDTTPDDIKASYGHYYREMIRNVEEVLGNLKDHFPGYDEEQGYELAGFVWFQGWNDMVDGSQREQQYSDYTLRLGQLIRDVRKDLNCSNLPVVIGELGAGEPGDFQKAQAAVAELPELKGTVAFVPTRQLWDPDLEAMVKAGVWKGPDWVKFYNRGSDRGYHYLGSTKIYYGMGKAFGEAMGDLMGK